MDDCNWTDNIRFFFGFKEKKVKIGNVLPTNVMHNMCKTRATMINKTTATTTTTTLKNNTRN